MAKRNPFLEKIGGNMDELQKIVEGLDRINSKLEEILEIQQTCYNSLCDIWVAPPKKTHKEITKCHIPKVDTN